MVRGKNEYLKTSVRTGKDTNLFSLEALVCRDETERWSREKAKDYSIPCEKPFVFTTFEQGQLTKIVKQTSDNVIYISGNGDTH